MTKDCSRGITRSKWFLPAFSLVLGLVPLAWLRPAAFFSGVAR